MEFEKSSTMYALPDEELIQFARGGGVWAVDRDSGKVLVRHGSASASDKTLSLAILKLRAA